MTVYPYRRNPEIFSQYNNNNNIIVQHYNIMQVQVVYIIPIADAVTAVTISQRKSQVADIIYYIIILQMKRRENRIRFHRFCFLSQSWIDYRRNDDCRSNGNPTVIQ